MRESWAGGRTAGDAAYAQGIRGDAGEVGSQRCRGIAQLMRLGWFRPVHCKSMSAQETRTLLTARKLVQTKLRDVENSLRGILRGFGLKVGKTTEREVRRTDRRTGGGPSASSGDCQGAAGGTSGAAVGVCSFRGAGAQDGAIGCADPAADVDAGGWPDRGADLCQRDRRSGPVQIVEAGGSPFRADPKKYQSGETDYTGRISKIGDSRCGPRSTSPPTSC